MIPFKQMLYSFYSYRLRRLIKQLLPVPACLAVALQPDVAQEKLGFYIVGAIGTVEITPKENYGPATGDFSSVGFGVTLSPYITSELVRHLESSSVHTRQSNGQKMNVNTSVTSLSMITKAPLAENLHKTEMMLRIGFAELQIQNTAPSLQQVSTNPLFGIGVQHQLTNRITLRIEHLRHGSDTTLAGNQISVALGFYLFVSALLIVHLAVISLCQSRVCG